MFYADDQGSSFYTAKTQDGHPPEASLAPEAGAICVLAALRAQAHPQQLADRRLVIDHENPERRGVHAAVSSRSVSAGIGSLIVKTAPRRSVRLPAAMVPCMASTKPREMASPSPVPART